MNTAQPATKPSDGAVAASIVLGIVIGLIWVLHLATVASLGHSDAAGNGIGQAYAAIQLIALWLLLTIMIVIASAKGAAPKPTTVAALVIVPVSGFVAMAATDLLARSHLSPFLWPIIIPALVPPLVVAWCFLALSASMLRVVVVKVAAGALLAAIFAVCVSIWPLSLMRNAVDDLEAARLEKYDADLARVPANAPLWDWTPFLDTQDSTKRAKVLDGIRSIDQRQAQAEAMLDRGDFPIGYLGFRSRSDACALREGTQPASQARRTAGAQNPRSQTVFRYRAAISRRHLRHELAGRLWLRVRRRIGGLGNHGQGIQQHQFRRLSSGRASRSQGTGANAARAP